MLLPRESAVPMYTEGFKRGVLLKLILPWSAFSPGASSSFPVILEMIAYKIKFKYLNLNLGALLS